MRAFNDRVQKFPQAEPFDPLSMGECFLNWDPYGRMPVAKVVWPPGVSQWNGTSQNQ